MRSFWSELRREWNWEKKFLVIIVGLVILSRIPSIFEPYWYGDEGVYQTIGLALSKGWVLYKDIHDNKPPFIYYLSMVGSQPAMRAILLVWMVAGTLIFYKLSKSVYGAKLAFYLTLIFAVVGNIPLLEGNIANAENFFIVLTTSGVLCTWKILAGGNRRVISLAFLGGLAFACGSLFKIPAAFDGFAAGLLMLLWGLFKKEFVFWKGAMFMGIGFILPWIGVGFFEWTQGAWSDFLREAILQNIGYLASWSRAASVVTFSLSPATLTGRLAITLGLTVFLIVIRNRLSFSTLFTAFWLVWAFFGATLSGRPYAHYFLQIVAPLILLVGGVLVEKRIAGRVLAVGLILSTFLAIASWNVWYYRTIPYYTNFAGWVTGRISQEAYWSYFDGRVPNLYALATYVSQSTTPDERVFVWGDQPSIYSLARRLPVGRYTTAYHVADFDPGGLETFSYLAKYPPRVIIFMNDEGVPFGQLSQMISKSYVRVKIIGYGTVYEKIPSL